MKICITAQTPDRNAVVAQRFGRAPHFVIYDEEDETFELIKNIQNMAAAAGAGVQSGTAVAEAGADLVLTGHIGPKAMSVLQRADIQVAVGAQGTVSDAIEAYRRGDLQPTDEPDRAPHW
jgi:predicted Fe-Mo cluster-binding NifX family protein